MSGELTFDPTQWEVLRTPLTLDNLVAARLPCGLGRIEVSRDESYRLAAVLTGSLELLPVFGAWFNEVVTESSVKTEPVEGSDASGRLRYVLNGVAPVPRQAPFATDRESERPFAGHLVANELLVESIEPRETAWLTDWYLNAPRTLLYARRTTRTQETTYARERRGPNWPAFRKTVPQNAFAFDHFIARCGYWQFVVAKVPKPLGPPWCESLGIEFRPEWGGIPDPAERRAIAEVVAFLFGRPLLRVGSTESDREGRLVRASAWSPPEPDARFVCGHAEWRPIPIPDTAPQVFEETVEALAPAYLEHREEWDLDYALWLQWRATWLPLGSSLVLLSAAFDTLKGGWFRSEKSESRGVWVDKERYLACTGTALEALETDLSALPGATSMVKKIKDAYRKGSGEQTSTFLSEIGLQIGPGEQAALAARNAPVHGNAVRANDVKRLWPLTEAFLTLLHRVILKMLRYGGEYIDYSVAGLPPRPLDEPVGLDPETLPHKPR